MRCQRSSVLLLALLWAVSFDALAQVSARSGAQSEAQPNEFASPMILEAPLDLSPIAQQGEAVVVSSLGGYSCQGVHLREISFGSKTTPKRRELVAEFVLWNDKGHDKKVDVGVSLLRDGGVITSSYLQGIAIEEKEKKTKTARIVLPTSDAGDLSGLTLRVEIEVADD
ncbi:MAG TPA: hypothetical protein VLT13_16230 [Bacteroidota bacterium]|nr:hypothetical protein [Bacteroidota bacterium]